ncbi:hypothetical protein LXL04_031117 [Taraxacum kok-saghyz]
MDHRAIETIPLAVCFVTTINKSQEQSFSKIGLTFLIEPEYDTNADKLISQEGPKIDGTYVINANIEQWEEAKQFSVSQCNTFSAHHLYHILSRMKIALDPQGEAGYESKSTPMNQFKIIRFDLTISPNLMMSKPMHQEELHSSPSQHLTGFRPSSKASLHQRADLPFDLRALGQ